MATDKDIEAAIEARGVKSPRITPAQIEGEIVAEFYATGHDLASAQHAFRVRRIDTIEVEGPLRLLTICTLVLRNGFTVVGTSACASADNFDGEIGRRIARSNAIDKVWPLLGYELLTRLSGRG